MRLTTTEMILAIEARIGRVDLTTENVPHEGPEPTVEYLSGPEADRRAGAEEDRTWRQWP